MEWTTSLQLSSIQSRIRHTKIKTKPKDCKTVSIKINKQKQIHRILEIFHQVPSLFNVYFGPKIKCHIDDKTIFKDDICLEYIRVSIPKYNLILDLITHYATKNKKTYIKLKSKIIKGDSFSLLHPIITKALTNKHVSYIKDKYLYIL